MDLRRVSKPCCRKAWTQHPEAALAHRDSLLGVVLPAAPSPSISFYSCLPSSLTYDAKVNGIVGARRRQALASFRGPAPPPSRLPPAPASCLVAYIENGILATRRPHSAPPLSRDYGMAPVLFFFILPLRCLGRRRGVRGVSGEGKRALVGTGNGQFAITVTLVNACHICLSGTLPPSLQTRAFPSSGTSPL